jgi:hypothetical protein
LRNVFETPDSHLEHDLVVVDGSLALIVEIKASPPTIPFRDPERAFVRLKRAFNAPTGIQRAFEQASRIRRRLTRGEVVPLYDGRGREVMRLDPSLHTNCICVCVTRDDFGPLATDLSLLLEREQGEPFPWVLNVLDLENIAEAWEHYRWGTRNLEEFLEFRLLAHNKVMGSDELEFVGFFIEHGSLRAAVENDADFLQLAPTYSNVFDEIYYYRHSGGPRPKKRKPKPPAVLDLRESLRADEPVFVEADGRLRRDSEPYVSPHRKCWCGSGRKLRRCHGRSGMPGG